MTSEYELPSVEELPPAPPAWYLTGGTAAGKSAVALELAERLNAEIVSLDSMTLYCDMDIGTAKPSAADRARVPHHLLDIVSPDQEFSLSQYVKAAHAAISEISSREKEVLFVGGTPLYLKSLLRGVYQGPPADWEFRELIESELKSVPIEALHERLQLIDPLAAAKLHPHDKRRIIRALEVFRATGQPLSHRQTHFDDGRAADQCRVFVLDWPRKELHQRINARVEQMFAGGLIDEVKELTRKYGTLSRTAAQAVGYREVLDFLASDQSSFKVCLERVQARTRQFARRQNTWFKSLSECTFVPQKADLSTADRAAEILRIQTARSMPTR